MSEKSIFVYLKGLGCCDACCLRYLGLKTPKVYENTNEYLVQQNFICPDQTPNDKKEINTNGNTEATTSHSTESGLPTAKKRKWEICICCVGVLQHQTWEEAEENVQQILNKKQYSCDTFACALSAPIATMFREKAITLLLQNFSPDTANKPLTPLKEAWKWSFGKHLANKIGKTLDSGAVSPLLVTINMEYPDDAEELEYLKLISPKCFEERGKDRKRFNVEFTRRSVELALEDVALRALTEHWACPPPAPVLPALCVSAHCVHAPLYLGGRYIKLTRELPQTPWVLKGKRMMESSVQEIIFEPIAELFEIPPGDAERRLKLVSAGREDVDVRCLGEGRPFAVEVTDPSLRPSPRDLKEACERVGRGGRVLVPVLTLIGREELTLLKTGEESKSKTYEALCIKLSHSAHDLASEPITVSQRDIDNINSYTNVTDGSCRVLLQQRTPIRVLHRRPLLIRSRRILELSASSVPGHPQLVLVRVRTEAGTYVKEWAHGDLGRTRPSLGDALGARADILALDVCSVQLHWPVTTPTTLTTHTTHTTIV